MSKWSYEGKRAVIVGCFSGMGEAAARELVSLGAELHGFDIRESPVKMASFTKVDLSDPASIDAAMASLPGDIDCLFNCSGLPQTFGAMAVMKVNFIGLRHWTEAWLPRIRKGGAVASIASTAAYRFTENMGPALDLVAEPDFESGVKWVEANPEPVGDGYGFSKQALVLYTLRRAVETVANGVRMNVTLPSPTDTPMWQEHFAKFVSPGVFKAFSGPIGRFSTPAEQADPLIFLNSDAAAMVNGHAMPVDGGFVGGVLSGAFDPIAIMAGASAT